jgi:uncharacterized protein YebE (UPF0316 family)
MIALAWLFILVVALVSLLPDNMMMMQAVVVTVAGFGIGIWVALVMKRHR